MTEPRPEDLRGATLTWNGTGLAFTGVTDGAGPEVSVALDGETTSGASPMELLLLSLAGCMAIDIRMILERSRVTIEELSVRVQGVRKDEHPKSYRKIDMQVRLRGPGPEDLPRVERAIKLSEDKYCSVHHSLDPSIEIETTFEIV